jgi:hypothetical protein
MFHSLAGKKITRKGADQYLIIKFPSSEIYTKYITNYEILKNYLRVPQILKVNFSQLIIYQEFIES